MPAVIFFASLDFEQKGSFMDEYQVKVNFKDRC